MMYWNLFGIIDKKKNTNFSEISRNFETNLLLLQTPGALEILVIFNSRNRGLNVTSCLENMIKAAVIVCTSKKLDSAQGCPLQKYIARGEV